MKSVLSIGAGGAFAGLVVPELAQRGARVRALVHNSNRAEVVRAQGAAEVLTGDLSDPASVEVALEDMEGVFYISPSTLANETEVGISLVRAAHAAGVRKFVFSSLIDPVLSAIPHHIAKAPIEEAIIESGMEFALLHPALFFQNISSSWKLIVESGIYAEPWSAETRFSRVDYRDVAEVAAIALTEDRLNYGTFELCSDGHLNRFEVAAIMSEVAGKKIQAERVEPKTFHEIPDTLRRMFEWYDSHALVGNSLTLKAILGREPRSLRDFLKELAK